MPNNEKSYDIGGQIGKNSGGDFTVAYLSATTLTLGTYPDASSVTADDIVAVEQFSSAGAPIAVITRDNKAMAVATNVLTVTGAAFGASDIFVIYTNVPRAGTTAPTIVTSGADGVSNTQNAETVSARISALNGSSTWDRIRAGITTVSATFTGFLNSLPWGIYNATPTSRTEGQGGPLQTTSRGAVNTNADTLTSGEDQTNNLVQIIQKPVAVSTYAYSRDSSTALEASSIAKASAGNLYRAFGVIDATAPTDMYYILFLDSATLTGDGAVTHLITPIPVNHVNGVDSSFDTGHFDFGVAAANGIVIVQSTTLVTKTIVTGASIAMFATVLSK